MALEPHPLRGVLLLLGSLFFFAALDATAKQLAATYSVPLLVWARYLVHCLLMVVLLGPQLGRRLLATRRPARQVVRALMLVGCTGCGFAALARMPLAETTAVAFTAPLLVAIRAGPWLGERLPPGRWLAVIGGFLGVLLIARPGGAASADGIALALLAAACYAVYQILTRQLAPGENTLTMLFYTALVGTLTMSVFLPWFWQAPATIPAGDLAAIFALGVLGGCGHFLLIRAFRHAPASLLSPFIYLQLVWAIALGAIVFGNWPDFPSLLGMAIIVSSGSSLALRLKR